MPASTGMQHRHLNHSRFTLASIDDVISRGGLDTWFRLRDRLCADSLTREKVLRVCRAHLHDPFAQRYHLWHRYAEQKA